MENYNMTYETLGSSALDPAYNQPRLRVVDGMGRPKVHAERPSLPRTVRSLASESVSWYLGADAPAAASSVLDDRQQLTGLLGILAVAALVIVMWALGL